MPKPNQHIERHIYLRDNGRYYVLLPRTKGMKGPSLSASCRSLPQARAKRTELEAIREARSTAKPKTTINPRWAVRVRLRNGSETVRHYAGRHPTAAADCARKREDVMLVLGVPSLSHENAA